MYCEFRGQASKMSRYKMLILDDNEDLLRALQVTIQKYEVLTATTLDEAADLARAVDVSFLVADIRLREGKSGHHIFELLFSRGKVVPGIVITAFEIGHDTRSELLYIGVSKVVKKAGSGLGREIGAAADAILADHRKRLAQLTTKVENLEIGNAVLSHHGEKKSIKDWLECIFAGNCSLAEENALKDLMVQACNRTSRPDGDSGYRFPEFGDA